MDSRSVQRSINKAWKAVDRAGLGDSFSNPTSLKVNEAFRNTALTEGVSYEEIYSKGLELPHYNFRLNDFSYFQFSWLGKDDVRFAYFPNPFIRTAPNADSLERLQELVKAQFLTAEEFLTIASDLRVSNRHPPIRYEYAESEYREFQHPCAHLHVGHPPRGRWCVGRPLSPLAFTLLMLKHSYPERWHETGADTDTETGNYFESLLIGERTLIGEVSHSLLTKLERRTFHFN